MSRSRKECLYFGRYRIRGKIGSGGFGVVFDAVDRERHRVALKVSRAGKQSAPTERIRRDLKRFEQEMQALTRVGQNARSFPQVLQTGWVEGHGFIAMRHVPGVRLHDYVRFYGGLPPIVSALIAQRLCRAMTFAHCFGYFHRDLKPTNVIIGPDGLPVIVDFGLVKSLNVHITQDFEAFGTVGYRAPEQRIDAKYTDGRADVYSIGMILLFCVTALPMDRGLKLNSDRRTVTVGGTSRVLRSALPPGLIRIIKRMIEVDCAVRWTMREAEIALTNFISNSNHAPAMPPIPVSLSGSRPLPIEPRWTKNLQALIRGLAFL